MTAKFAWFLVYFQIDIYFKLAINEELSRKTTAEAAGVRQLSAVLSTGIPSFAFWGKVSGNILTMIRARMELAR